MIKYLCACLIIEKHILLPIAAFGHRLKLITSIFTDSLTWFLILPRIFLQKYNSLLSCFCRTKLPMKFAINRKILYLRHNNRTLIILKKKAEPRHNAEKERKKAKRKILEFLASGCPECQDAPGVRIPEVSCLA